MPEGPSIVILGEQAAGFAGRKVLRVAGNSTQDIGRALHRWKKDFVLKKNHQVHTRSTCPRDGARLAYRRSRGQAQRRAFFCETCQRLYTA